MYLRQNSMICYELSRITTSNLRALKHPSILRNVTIHRIFYVLVTTCLRVVSNSCKLGTSIYESLRCFAKKYIKPAKFDNKSYKKFLRAVYRWLHVVASGLRYLRIVTSYLRKINPWKIVRRFLTCQKICLSFHGSVTVSASCDELFTDISELLWMLGIDYELAIRKDS